MVMLKKVLMGGSAAMVLGGLLVGTGLSSYVRSGWGWVRHTVKDAVPVEMEMARARQMIADLQPEIARNMQVIARERVEVARLERDVEKKHEQLSSAKSDMFKLKDDLAAGSPTYVYKGISFTSQQVRDDLSKRFARYRTQEATTSKLEQMLAARRQCLQAANDRVDAMLAAKRQLEVEIENLQARLAAVEVAQTQSDLALDDSVLSNTRRLIDEIGSRIDVEEQMLTVNSEYSGAIELEDALSAESGDILEEIAQHFSGDAETRLAQAQP
jgi:septal ring factor EnvC (AmiA/AmiB activator)